MKAILVLEDGTVFEGLSIGSAGRTLGEVVFSTAMTGYQEMLTDPSYRGQILNLTYPLIGNYGANPGDLESDRPQVAGFVVRELCQAPSNWRQEQSLDSFLKQHGVVAISGVDTRALTRRLRAQGVMMGAISTDESPDQALKRIRQSPGYAELDFVRQVTTASPYQFNSREQGGRYQAEMRFDGGARIAVLDYGVKRNIVRILAGLGCEALVLPATSTAQQILDLKPAGVVLSPGPGNPALLGYAIECIRGLVGRAPIMGICLGHQLLACALGGRNFKLKFGHRGANHPVKDLETGRAYITSQNHGFAVDPDSLSGSGLEVTQVNLNDGTVEGMRHISEPIFCIQYHPEASPGPMDNRGLFERFLEIIHDQQTK